MRLRGLPDNGQPQLTIDELGRQVSEQERHHSNSISGGDYTPGSPDSTVVSYYFRVDDILPSDGEC